MMNQKEGVFNAIVSVLKEVGKAIVDGVACKLDDSERKSVIGIVANGLHNGDIALSADAKAKYDTVDKLEKKYVPGLVSNWLRKDTRLNGGEKYVTKNPGSRAGQGDETLKNLKLLKGTLTDAEQIAAVQSEIDKRVEEIKKEKQKDVKVDLTKIPVELRQQLGLETEESTEES